MKKVDFPNFFSETNTLTTIATSLYETVFSHLLIFKGSIKVIKAWYLTEIILPLTKSLLVVKIQGCNWIRGK